jgi:RNA processing factor Prp31
MTTTRIDVMTAEERKRLRKELEKQIAEFEAKGGKITQCPRNAYTETEVEGKPKRKFSSVHGGEKGLTLTANPAKRTAGGFVPRKKGE